MGAVLRAPYCGRLAGGWRSGGRLAGSWRAARRRAVVGSATWNRWSGGATCGVLIWRDMPRHSHWQRSHWQRNTSTTSTQPRVVSRPHVHPLQAYDLALKWHTCDVMGIGSEWRGGDRRGVVWRGVAWGGVA